MPEVHATLPPMGKRPATYQDVIDAPEGFTAEIIGGELYLSPQPAVPHQVTASELGHDLVGPFRRGRDGPGGWLILDEVELWLGPPGREDTEVLVPDLSAWRRERFAQPTRGVGCTVRPDWVCEVLSPSTARRDRILKLDVYAREGIPHAWLIDPREETVEVYTLTDRGAYERTVAVAGDVEARLPPFDAVGLRTGPWWVSALAG